MDNNKFAGDTKRMLSSREIATFCTQIAMILRAGISVGEGLSIMVEDMPNAQGKEVIQELYNQVEMGKPFYAALDYVGMFPRYVVNMVEIGEKAGKLDDVLTSLCSYYEREEAVAKSIRNAVAYPMVMIGMMLLVVLVLLVQVLPIFNQVFVQLGSQMSGFSRSMLDLGGAIGKYSIGIASVLGALLVAFLVFRVTPKGRDLLDQWKSSFFATRKVAAKIASGRFASAMALMLSSGLDTAQSLEMTYKLIDNKTTRKKIQACKEGMENGQSFSDALVQAGIFSGVYARMVAVGFKTGSVDSVMSKIADLYEEEVDTRIANTISVLEPTLVAVLSILVGMILLSVMLPLMGIMASIG